MWPFPDIIPDSISGDTTTTIDNTKTVSGNTGTTWGANVTVSDGTATVWTSDLGALKLAEGIAADAQRTAQTALARAADVLDTAGGGDTTKLGKLGVILLAGLALVALVIWGLAKVFKRKDS